MLHPELCAILSPKVRSCFHHWFNVRFIVPAVIHAIKVIDELLKREHGDVARFHLLTLEQVQ